MKLTGVMVNSENPKTLGEFYEKIFGNPGMQQDDWYGFSVGGGYLMVGPHSDVHGKSQEPARIMVSYEADDVKAAFEEVKKAGATVIAEPYQPSATETPDIWLATLADPDGNYIQISTPWEE